MRELRTGSIGVAPANGVGPNKRHHLAIVEAHAAEYVANVLDRSADRSLVGVREAA